LLGPDQRWCVEQYGALMNETDEIAARLQEDFFTKNPFSSSKDI
jgi:hypothetical protein